MINKKGNNERITRKKEKATPSTDVAPAKGLSLLERLQKNSTIKETSILEDSKFFDEPDPIPTQIPMINVSLSGDIDGGLISGLTVFAGPSKHFKTGFALMLAKAFMDKYPDGVILFYDSEFGAPKSYFASFGIDTSRVLHTPLLDMEQFKFDIMHHFDSDNKEGIKRGDHVFILVDSMGNLASKKEIVDATDGKSTADMTRAKQNKSIFRMLTPHLRTKNIPMVVIQHTYKSQETYSKDVVSGGTGLYYSADNIFILGRQQDKPADEIIGFNFVINVEKSRLVKEKSKFFINVTFEGGMSKWSGLMEEALDSGHVIKPKAGWYAKVDKTTGEVGKNCRLAETNSKDFWQDILDDETFKSFVKTKYTLSSADMISDNEIDAAYEELGDE